MLATRMRMAAAGVSVGGNWWQAGGASGAIGVWQAKGAASLSASYTDLSGNGNNLAVISIPPGWSISTGWAFNGTNNPLDTGLVPTSTWSMLVRYSGWSVVANRGLMGAQNPILLQPSNAAGTGVAYSHGSVVVVAPTLAGGVLAVAGPNGYRNGSLESSSLGSTNATNSVLIASVRSTTFFQGDVQAAALYNTTLTGPQVAAVSAAMAAL